MILELILAIENEEQRTIVEHIYDKLYPLMYQNAYNILRNHHDTEDAIMETFIKIINHAEKFVLDDQNEIIALVLIYTRNTTKTCYKRRQKRTTISLTMYADEDSFETKQRDIQDERENLEQMIINKETVQMFSNALQELVEEQRDAIMLKYYYGHRYAEISKELGISENAARARVFRGKEKLKELLGDEIYERLKF